jgi:hypothetical protein
VLKFLVGKRISTMDHLLYSPDLAPDDFWLFPELKSVLKGKCFSNIEDINLSVKIILTGIPVQDFKNCFEQWLKHLGHCKEVEGDYFEKL